MTDTVDALTEELNQLFSLPSNAVSNTILGELQSILRIHQLDPEDLSFKWESYCMKMGAEETQMDLKTVRDFKKDLQETLEREASKKVHKTTEKRTVGATPRAGLAGGDVFSMLDGIVPNTPRTGAARPLNGSSIKRKSNFETPAAKSNRAQYMSSPNDLRTPDTATIPSTAFVERKDAGAIQESLNPRIELPEPNIDLPSEPRLKLTARTEIAKFSYKTMAMKLSEATEILDDRIDEFEELVRTHHKLDDEAFGNASRKSPDEIIAVGRICSDSGEPKLNPASLVLETSRRRGNGLRVPLKVDEVSDYQFFAGKIVAVKGSNAGGEFFTVKEILEIPELKPVGSGIESIDLINDRIASTDGASRPLVNLVASGPYTTDDNLDFSPLLALLEAAQESQADGLVLLGPFVDAEHPLIQSGDFDLPDNYPTAPDQATLNDVFRAYISAPIQKLAKAMPSITIIMVPSVRDAIAKHAAWPQDRIAKKDLGLPRQATIVPNPMLLSLNEAMFGMSSLDVLDELRASEVVGGKTRQTNVLERLSRQLIEQRHFFPVFPPSNRRAAAHEDGDEVPSGPLGPMLDVSYLKLGDWLGVKPDVLITPSVLPPFARVFAGVVSINPGTLSKKRGPGTYARMVILSREITDDERDGNDRIGHNMYERCRVDIVKI